MQDETDIEKVAILDIDYHHGQLLSLHIVVVNADAYSALQATVSEGRACAGRLSLIGAMHMQEPQRSFMTIPVSSTCLFTARPITRVCSQPPTSRSVDSPPN